MLSMPRAFTWIMHRPTCSMLAPVTCVWVHFTHILTLDNTGSFTQAHSHIPKRHCTRSSVHSARARWFSCGCVDSRFYHTSHFILFILWAHVFCVMKAHRMVYACNFADFTMTMNSQREILNSWMSCMNLNWRCCYGTRIHIHTPTHTHTRTDCTHKLTRHRPFSHRAPDVQVKDYLVCHTNPPFGNTPSSTDGCPENPLSATQGEQAPVVVHVYNLLNGTESLSPGEDSFDFMSTIARRACL